MKKMSEKVPYSPSVFQIVERSLANYSNQQGVQKLFSLLEAIDNLKNFLIVSWGEEKTKEKIEKELQKYSTKFKKYDNFNRFILVSRKKINEAQVIYDLNKSKKSEGKRGYEIKIAKKITPYQEELYLFFYILLKLGEWENKVISRELLRSPEEMKTKINSFEK